MTWEQNEETSWEQNRSYNDDNDNTWKNSNSYGYDDESKADDGNDYGWSRGPAPIELADTHPYVMLAKEIKLLKEHIESIKAVHQDIEAIEGAVTDNKKAMEKLKDSELPWVETEVETFHEQRTNFQENDKPKVQAQIDEWNVKLDKLKEKLLKIDLQEEEKDDEDDAEDGNTWGGNKNSWDDEANKNENSWEDKWGSRNDDNDKWNSDSRW